MRSLDCILPRYRPLMEAQVIIHLAGGIAEAIHRGVRHELLRFAEAYCEVDADMEQARAVLGDLFRVTAYRFEARDFDGRWRCC